MKAGDVVNNGWTIGRVLAVYQGWVWVLAPFEGEGHTPLTWRREDVRIGRLPK